MALAPVPVRRMGEATTTPEGESLEEVKRDYKRNSMLVRVLKSIQGRWKRD
jgi:hypothetical protein